MEASLPDKLYFKIGEVSRIASLRTSVLRFWETEFKELKPSKNRSGQRVYTKQDVELVLHIRQLLYGEKLTIEGARSRLAGNRKSGHHEVADTESNLLNAAKLLKDIREELVQIRNLL